LQWKSDDDAFVNQYYGSSKPMRRLILPILLFLNISFNLAHAKTDYRCGVRLIFDSDGSGSVANYVLSLQVKNTTGRAINGVSVIYKDRENRVIGNTFLNCSINSQDVKPGSYGECIRTLQRVDGAYINSFGIEKWTEIVNTQLKALNSIQYCEALGFAY
tara:strand:- start:995 stop:1474 length:480 start_codon:yes stop_codon:yes gene_type:complete